MGIIHGGGRQLLLRNGVIQVSGRGVVCYSGLARSIGGSGCLQFFGLQSVRFMEADDEDLGPHSLTLECIHCGMGYTSALMSGIRSKMGTCLG